MPANQIRRKSLLNFTSFSNYICFLMISATVCLLQDDCFQENYLCTIGVDFRFRTLQINQSTIKLQIWDTAGQERYRTITNAYYKGADGIIVVFDMTNRESFLSIPVWLSEIEKHSGTDIQVMVLANKMDDEAEIQVTDEEIAQFESEHPNIPLIKTSAKFGTNVDDSFLELTKKLIIDTNKKGSGGASQDRQRTMGLALKRLQLQEGGT